MSTIISYYMHLFHFIWLYRNSKPSISFFILKKHQAHEIDFWRSIFLKKSPPSSHHPSIFDKTSCLEVDLQHSPRSNYPTNWWFGLLEVLLSNKSFLGYAKISRKPSASILKSEGRRILKVQVFGKSKGIKSWNLTKKGKFAAKKKVSNSY